MNTTSKSISIARVADSAAAAQTDVTSDGVDMVGYSGAEFVCLIGDITATGTVAMKIQQSDDDGVADAYSDLTGATVAADDADSDLLLRLEVAKPRKRYLRAVVTRATANSVIDGVLVLRYNAVREPITEDTSVAGAVFVHAPAEV